MIEDGQWERHDKDKIRSGPLRSVTAFLQSWLFLAFSLRTWAPMRKLISSLSDSKTITALAHYYVEVIKYLRPWKDRELREDQVGIGD